MDYNPIDYRYITYKPHDELDTSRAVLVEMRQAQVSHSGIVGVLHGLTIPREGAVC